MWKFQIISNRPDYIAKGRLMDPVCKGVEDQVNDALRYPFRFHKVNKIVLCLGRGTLNEPDYIEQLGVALKQWPDFDLERYVALSADDKVAALRAVVLQTFDWLESSFKDAQFVGVGRRNLEWAK